MLAVFDRQHHGKPNRNDYGAQADLNNDGQVDSWERESELTPLYIESAKYHMSYAGHETIVEEEGWYSERHIRACTAAQKYNKPTAYVACHLNAGGGDYAALFYDARSQNGKLLASSIAASLGEADLPGINRVVVKSAIPDDWTRNALYTIKGIYAGPANISGVCFEPLFIDNEEHQKLLTPEGLAWIGMALSRGILRWGMGNRIA